MRKNLRLNALTDRVTKLEPKRRGRIFFVDGLNGQTRQDVLPPDYDPRCDIVFEIEDVAVAPDRKPRNA